MLKKYFIPLSILLSGMGIAKPIIQCTVAQGSTIGCDSYGSKFLKVKSITYDRDTNQLIVKKTMPIPKEKHTFKKFSIKNTVEKYTKVQNPLRFGKTLQASFHRKLIDDSIKKNKVLTTAIKKKTLDENKVKIVCGKYKIVKGNMLSRIAQKFGVTTKQLTELNKFKDNNHICFGQKIKIPFPQKITNSFVSGRYKVEKNDTLIIIANKFNLKPKDLTKFNNLKSSSDIYKGRILKLPLPYILKKIKRAKEQKKLDAIEKREKAKKRKAEKQKKQEKKRREKAKLKRKNKEKIKAKAWLKRKKIEKRRAKARLKRKNKYTYKQLSQQIKRKQKKRYNFYRSKSSKKFKRNRLRVTATAYTSHANQTDSTPFIAAWNNRLRPGSKIIAVSRDMLTRYGMRNGTRVRISGLSGYYTVRDKMNKRYKKRIDIYMGLDRRRALRWGRRSVVINW